MEKQLVLDDINLWFRRLSVDCRSHFQRPPLACLVPKDTTITPALLVRKFGFFSERLREAMTNSDGCHWSLLNELDF